MKKIIVEKGRRRLRVKLFAENLLLSLKSSEFIKFINFSIKLAQFLQSHFYANLTCFSHIFFHFISLLPFFLFLDFIENIITKLESYYKSDCKYQPYLLSQ